MPYARGPYERFHALPAPARPAVHSSREVDFSAGRYSFDATTGAFESMSSVGQRVVILVAQTVPRTAFLTDQDLAGRRQDIERALLPLAADIADLVVEVTSPSSGREAVRVSYLDISTGLNQTVQLT